MRLLIEKGARINDLDYTKRNALMIACEINRQDLIDLLLEKGAEVKQVPGANGSPLISSFANLDLLRFLVSRGADVNEADEDRTTALMKACAFGLLEHIQFLIENGADVDQRDRHCSTALLVASSRGHEKWPRSSSLMELILSSYTRPAGR